MKIQKPLVDTPKQIEKQTAQINKINQNLQSLQKQFKPGKRQSDALKFKRASKEDNFLLSYFC